ncbi:MAG: ATP-binding cassette domain-containing protein, partial [Chlamydiales bacterium]
SGGGKSTLIDLLLRLYNPSVGNIFLDGKKISDYDITSWRKLFGVVTQDTFLFNDTVEENIRFGELKASRKQIVEMAKLAGAHDFISLLPKGYETVVGDRGYRLSGGEKQRLSLARCLVRDPQILVLDEATSNLDSCSESVIQNTLEKFNKEKTMIVIAHRLSTITHADLICVIENGQIIEKGTHGALLKSKGRYHFYWNLQASGLLNSSQPNAV